MKKLILTAAILASGVSTFALSNNIFPVETVSIEMSQEFVEISVDKLSEVIINAVGKDYAGATISKAYVNSNEQYKLELTAEEISKTVYIDKDGNWLDASTFEGTDEKE